MIDNRDFNSDDSMYMINKMIMSMVMKMGMKMLTEDCQKMG